jgi:hypothetical protein
MHTVRNKELEMKKVIVVGLIAVLGAVGQAQAWGNRGKGLVTGFAAGAAGAFLIHQLSKPQQDAPQQMQANCSGSGCGGGQMPVAYYGSAPVYIQPVYVQQQQQQPQPAPCVAAFDINNRYLGCYYR